jgi:opacity protein-like surface antigen
MKRLALFCGAMLLFAGIASAQDSPKAEVFGGYSFVHVSDNGTSTNFNGGSGSLSYNLTPWLGVVGDFGGYHWGQNGGDANLVTYLFGPKISYRRGPITPFAQVLLGGGRLSGSGGGSENAFAMTVGAGVDWNATPHLGIRLIQAEYLMTKFTDGINNRQNSARVSTGVVLRW